MAQIKPPKAPGKGAGGLDEEPVISGYELDKRRSDLEQKLNRLHREEKREDEDKESDNVNISQAIKISSEFLAGIVVGALLGLGFDSVLSTSPWGLIVFLFLGFAAGILNVLRSLGKGNKSATLKAPAKHE